MKRIYEFAFFIGDDDEAFRIIEHRHFSLTVAHNVIHVHLFGKVTIMTKVGCIFGSLHVVKRMSVSDDGSGVVVVLEGHGVSLLLPLLYSHMSKCQHHIVLQCKLLIYKDFLELPKMLNEFNILGFVLALRYRVSNYGNVTPHHNVIVMNVIRKVIISQNLHAI
jgi:hypothetical protein